LTDHYGLWLPGGCGWLCVIEPIDGRAISRHVDAKTNPRAAGGMAAVMRREQFRVLVKLPAIHLVLDPVVRKMNLVVEVRQIVLACGPVITVAHVVHARQFVAEIPRVVLARIIPSRVGHRSSLGGAAAVVVRENVLGVVGFGVFLLTSERKALILPLGA
jgi:hypothetical protein